MDRHCRLMDPIRLHNLRLEPGGAAGLECRREIAELLSGRGTRLTARAVDAHVEYLTGKLGLRRGSGRDILVAAAIRRGLLA